MNYRLVVLTHGQDMAPIMETLKSYPKYVSPPPTKIAIVHDGQYLTDPLLLIARSMGAAITTTPSGPVGFCGATKRSWEIGVGIDPIEGGMEEDPPDFYFHLEHDFRFERHVDLGLMAQVLEGDHSLAQMSLRRDETPDERFQEGIFGHPHELFEERDHILGVPIQDNLVSPYLVQSIYFTTNPSLMRRQFMVENPWPDYADQCEGRFSIDLRERGYKFGIWGGREDPPAVTHIGRRDRHGFGY